MKTFAMVLVKFAMGVADNPILKPFGRIALELALRLGPKHWRK